MKRVGAKPCPGPRTRSLSELLVADIGGTGSRLALMVDGRRVGETAVYSNRDFEAFDAVLADFIARHEGTPDRALLSVAGKIDQGHRKKCRNSLTSSKGWPRPPESIPMVFYNFSFRCYRNTTAKLLRLLVLQLIRSLLNCQDYAC